MTQLNTQQKRPHNGHHKPRRPPAPQVSAQAIRESFKPQGSAVTRRKNRSQRRLVQELFPALFVNGYPLPMKSGIKDDMLTQIVRRGLDISEERLQAALRACCASLVYRTRLFTYRFRRDVDGKPVEQISADDRKHAWSQLVDYRKRHKLPEIKPSWFKGARKKGPQKGQKKSQKGYRTAQTSSAI